MPTIQHLDEQWKKIIRCEYDESCGYYLELRRILKAERNASGYCDDDRRKIQTMLDDIENRMKPTLGFLGGSTMA
jgi:hypothetical protein